MLPKKYQIIANIFQKFRKKKIFEPKNYRWQVYVPSRPAIIPFSKMGFLWLPLWLVLILWLKT